jgi:hypothetical protein
VIDLVASEEAKIYVTFAMICRIIISFMKIEGFEMPGFGVFTHSQTHIFLDFR